MKASYARLGRLAIGPQVVNLPHTLMLLGMFAWPGLAAISSFRVVGTTSTQAVIVYNAPDGGPVTIQVSSNSSLTPLAFDVDPNTFANSNSDLARPGTVTQGLQRTLVIGRRTAQLATAGPYAPSGSYAGRHFSRALQAYTTYYGQLTDDLGATYNFTFQTTNIPLGDTYGDPWLADAVRPGEQPWPETIGGSSPESFIDPLTGMLLVRMSTRSTNWIGWWNAPGLSSPVYFGTAYDQTQTPCDSAGPWTNPCGAIVSGGTGNTTVGNSQSVLVLRPPMGTNLALPFGNSARSYGSTVSLDQLGVNITGTINSTNPAFQALDVCLSLNGGATCASANAQISLAGASSTQVAGQFSTTSYGTTSWLLDTYPRVNAQRASPNYGTDTVSGSTVTWQSNSAAYWDLSSVYGGNGHIRMSTISENDACAVGSGTSAEYTITGFVNGTNITVSPAPPAGANYWCMLNFAIMIWRDKAPTDGSTVTLTGAYLSVIESYNPTIPDNGDGIECLGNQVSGGYWCMFGGIEWINPATGANVYFGDAYSAPGSSGHGNLTTNTWSAIQAPYAEGSMIDQTQNQLTFYTAGYEPGNGGPLVIQCVFNPSPIALPGVPYSNGNTIGNASISSTTAYSVTYGNGLTCTNLTPASLNKTVVNQMATFDPTFSPATFSSGQNGWNCSSAYAETAGTFYFNCFAEGGDSYAWIFAFSPGNGNPADAGQPGGPQIIGAVSTFNSPEGPVSAMQTAMVGHTLHALVSAGNNGWVSMNMHVGAPINTTSTAVPASSSTLCSSFGLTGNSHQCILLTINSYTGGGGTGYEPYLASPPYSNFSSAPGLLRITQIGDTACIRTGSGTCNWYQPGNQELLTLVSKNYGGTQGAWVFQRDAYGTEVATACSPSCNLYWNSIEWILPTGNTSQTNALTAYWNAAAGCGGLPDPHGTCMLQDTNETMGHGEWESGGGAVATNVPEWGQPIWGWPTDYQTTVGSVPGIISNPFTNLTPFVTPSVNYVSANPPFAGVYGHPWGFDTGSHTNAAGQNAPANELSRAFDNSPVQGGQNEPSYTNTAGQLWVATPASNVDNDDVFGYGSIVAINRKLMATAMSCGAHPVVDVSGPASVISSSPSGSYTGCIVRNNGECYPGSTTGQIYVNCPGVIPNWNTCTGSGIHGGTPLGVGNDICVGNIGSEADALRQFSLTATDLYGAYTRTLATATSRLRLVTGFENNRLTPDNSWILFRMEFPEYQSQEMWMGRMMPYPSPDSVARGTFVPVSITLQPPAGLAVNNAVIQFGYQEYGAPAALNCTTRNDPCVATGSAVPAGNSPFFFAAENPSGNSCATGCTVTIPAISQRILYYRVQYRAANNAVLSTGALTAVVVP